MNSNPTIWDDLKREVRTGSVLTRLILLTSGVFLFQALVALIQFLANGQSDLTSGFLEFFYATTNLSELIRKPWSLLTYMFFHGGILHVLFNMLFLYWFGRILVNYIGDRKLLPIFISGGVFGVLISIAIINIAPGLEAFRYSQIVGASAGVTAIMAASATLVPNHIVYLPIIGAVRLQYVAIFFILMDLILIPGDNAGGRLAHLGGATYGFVFIKQLQGGRDWSIWFNRVMDGLVTLFTSRKKGPRVGYKSNRAKQAAHASTVNRNGPLKRTKRKSSEPSQEHIDRILDKISRSGYESLTKEEKEILFRASKQK